MSVQVAIVMGSTSDAPIMAVAEETLKGLGIEHEVRVLSAHRTPDELREWACGLAGRGVKVVIAAAGGAAHLAGAERITWPGRFYRSDIAASEGRVQVTG